MRSLTCAISLQPYLSSNTLAFINKWHSGGWRWRRVIPHGCHMEEDERKKRGRDTLLPEMALTQRGGVNSPSDVLQWNQSNYSPASACVISSTDVKIIASTQLKFNATAPTSQPRMQKTWRWLVPPVGRSASAPRGHPLPTSLACTSRDLIGGGLCHCGCQRGAFAWDHSWKNMSCSSLLVNSSCTFSSAPPAPFIRNGPVINFHNNAKMHKARAALFYFL